MLTLTDFTGGLWLIDQNEMALPANALVLASNLDYLPTGGIRGRRGRAPYNATPLPGAVLSLWRHYPRAGTPATLAAFQNGATVEIRHDTLGNGTFSPVIGGSGFAANTRWHFANWPSKNATFLANGVDSMRGYNGVLADLGTTPKRGPYLTVWQSHLWATEPTELNFSVYCSDVDDETVWPPDNHLNVSDAQGGRIVGLAGWQDRLIIFKSTGLWSFFGDIDLPVSSNLQQYSDQGCVAPESIAVTPFGLLYTGRDGQYLTDGLRSLPLELSRPIRPVFVSAASQSTFSGAIGLWYPRRAEYWLSFTAGYEPTAIVQRLLRPDGHEAWAWKLSPGLAINAGCVWDAEAEDGRLLIGDTTGRVWITDTGTTDNGAAIVTSVKTMAHLLDPGLQRTGRLTKVFSLHRASVPLAGAVEYDFSGRNDQAFSLGGTGMAVRDSRATLWDDLSTQGRFAAVSLTNPVDASAYELHRLDLQTRLKAARRWP